MPAPQADLFKQAVRAKFTTFAIKVPINWRKPQGEAGSQFNGAFRRNELETEPGSPPLFLPATHLSLHTTIQKEHIKNYGALMDDLVDAICKAWSTWQSAATLVGVVINTAAAAGGQVVGPPWAPLIMAAGPKGNPFQVKFTNAVATALGNAWLSFTSSIKVPGLPWYPMFGTVPAPVAPPTPNIPCSFSQLVSVPASLTPAVLKSQMVAALADPGVQHADKVFEALADGFDKMFTTWKTTTMVTNVMGTGPVPIYAPPVVMAGPVVGGVGTMTPGGFT